MIYKYLVIILVIIIGLSFINIGVINNQFEGFEIDTPITEVSTPTHFNEHIYDSPNNILEEQAWKYPQPGAANPDKKPTESQYSITLDEIKKYLVGGDSKPASGQAVEIKHCIGVWDREWSSCDKQCGGGVRKKLYRILSPAGPGGIKCSYADGDVREEQCNTLPCPIDCVGSWGNWSECDKNCFPGEGDYGERKRSFGITTYAKDGYLNDEFKAAIRCNYTHDEIEKQECNTEYCAIDCKGSYTGYKKDCSEKCGGGIRENIYNITRYPKPGWFRGKRVEGKECPKHKYTKCNLKKCPE